MINSFLDYLTFGDRIETYLPDFILAFAFFTGLIFAVLSRRLGLQRSVALVAVSLGAALATGLVWWEQANGFSIRNLGPIAAGFAMIILGGIIYQSLRQVGGSWAGAGIALGASLLVGWTLGIDWPIAPEIVQTIAGVTLTVGILAFLLHRRGSFGHFHHAPRELSDVRHDMNNLYEDRRAFDFLRGGFRRLKRRASSLFDHPEGADDVMLQLKRMLPAEGWLTQRLARLRERAHRMRQGHIARIDELRGNISKLPPLAKRKLSAEIVACYKELNLDVRLERLDKACAENERRIRELTRQAQNSLERSEYRSTVEILEQASKLQAHNARLFRAIDRTEKRLVVAIRKVAAAVRVDESVEVRSR